MEPRSVHRAMLSGAFDYAGLFPPAQLEPASALEHYRTYQASGDSWALGRFVMPASGLTALLEGGGNGPALPLSVVIGADAREDLAAVERVRALAPGGLAVAAVEARAAAGPALHQLLDALPAGLARYVELPLAPDLGPALDALAAGGAYAKVRTGGIVAGAFPDPDALLEFLVGTAERRLPFKATAGLHHPLRGRYRLTYAPDSECATMYGFLNLLLAATLIWDGAPRATAREVLLEAAPDQLRFEPDAVVWRELRIQTSRLGEARREFIHSIGTCSFREPLDELVAGGWG